MNKKLNYWLAVSASLVMATSPAILSSCSDDDDDDDPKKEQGDNDNNSNGNGGNNGGNNGNNQGNGTYDPTQLPDPSNAVEATTSGFNYVIINDTEVSISAITVGKKEMVIPAYVKIDGKTYKVVDLEKNIFNNEGDGLDYLEKLTLPGTMTEIKDDFDDITGVSKCRNLKEIIFSQGVEIIGDDAFHGTYVENLLFTIPYSVKSVGTSNFYGYEGKVIRGSIKIMTDDGVLYDENRSTLLLCGTNVKGKFTIPSSVKEVAEDAFEYCSEGLTVVVPSTVESYQISSFYPANVEFTFNPITESGKKGGYGYVDLGLSVKWATCNLGATTPEGYGDYYRWGEVEPYTENSAKYEYSDLGDVLPAANDAATANWGAEWRMPTREEQDELMEKCNTVYAKYNGVDGVYFISKVNQKGIFLPCAGFRRGSDVFNVGSHGEYWSSSVYGGSCAYLVSFGSDYANVNYGLSRDEGCSVRPATE